MSSDPHVVRVTEADGSVTEHELHGFTDEELDDEEIMAALLAGDMNLFMLLASAK